MLRYDPVSFEPRRPVTWEAKGESASPPLASRVILWSQNEESSIQLHAECTFHFLLKIDILFIWLMLSSTVTYRYRPIFNSICASWVLNTWLLGVSSIMFHLSQGNIIIFSTLLLLLIPIVYQPFHMQVVHFLLPFCEFCYSCEFGMIKHTRGRKCAQTSQFFPFI